MVATAHPLATAAGLRVLREGGSAVDAAVAAAAVTWVTLPMMCSPGGDAFLLIYEARTGRYTAINGSGRVGARATADYLRARGFSDAMPKDGPLSVTIPGAVDAFETALTRFGTRGWADLLQEAIRHAESHPLTAFSAGYFAQEQAKLQRFASTARIYFKNGAPPEAGTLLRQPEYAESLRQIARGGAHQFYQGALGAAIAAHQDRNGLWNAEELAAHRSEVYTPLTAEYRGFRIHQFRPPSQGMIHLQEMAMLNHLDLSSLSYADVHHVMVEAKKLAFADRHRYAGDPAFVDIPLDGLLSPAYARQRAQQIRLDAALPLESWGIPENHTAYLCVVDRDGNAVSLIHSIAALFGSGEVIEGTGLFLNNRASAFRLQEGHPNSIAPHKRPVHTLNCYMVSRDGLPCLVGGTPGGDGQPQWNMQVLVHFLDYGLNVQQAAEAPRWRHEPGSYLAATAPVLSMEAGFPAEVVSRLESLGHPVRVIPHWSGDGAAQLIYIDRARGVLQGGSDPRAPGMAAGN